MKPTRKRNLVLLSAVALLFGITIERLYLSVTGLVIPVSPWTPAAVLCMVITLIIWALTVRRRLLHLARARHEQRSPGTPFVMQEPPLEPMVAARTVALAFAASRAGALLVGLYAGIALLLLRHWGSGDIQARFWFSVVTVVLSLGMVIVALWLERMCSLPDPPAGAQTSVA